MRVWINSGAPWIWLNAGAVSISLIMVAGLLALIAVRGLGHFWPASVMELTYLEHNGSKIRLIGEIRDREVVPAARLTAAGFDLGGNQGDVTRYLVKTANRDLTGMDFRWIIEPRIEHQYYPQTIMVVERREWGDLYGYLHAVKDDGMVIATGNVAGPELQKHLSSALDLFAKIQRIEKHEIGAVNQGMERLRLRERRLELDKIQDPAPRAEIKRQRAELENIYTGLQQRLTDLHLKIQRHGIMVEVMDGSLKEIPLAKIVRIYQPHAMGLVEKLGSYVEKFWEFVSDDPREANTEGGIFPAIFGTVMMVMIMTMIVTPFGVVAAVYLREYARQDLLTRVIRIAVNNLAGVPSIVYGIFGLGFFVYFLGGNIDQLFYPEALPAPTFGTPGLLWSSLTLAILTLPVVIVATEEGLARIPRSIREGSLALGATKAETLWRTVLPMASPAIMTGVILAVARAAGEVAPLMLVGVVKLAPSLPVDGILPFIHLERKFMHLGFHIYDVGFQSPNVEAARSLVYATALLLVFVIVTLNLAAIIIRNRLREKYRTLEG